MVLLLSELIPKICSGNVKLHITFLHLSFSSITGDPPSPVKRDLADSSVSSCLVACPGTGTRNIFFALISSRMAANVGEEEATVSLVDVLEEDEELENEASAVLGGSDSEKCSYPEVRRLYVNADFSNNPFSASGSYLDTAHCILVFNIILAKCFDLGLAQDIINNA